MAKVANWQPTDLKKKKNLEKKNVKNLSILGQVTIQTNANKPFGNSQICMSRDQVELISLR